MTFHPIPNVAQVDMIYTQVNNPCENRYFVLGAGAWDATSIQALAGQFLDWEHTTAKAMRNVNTTLVKILARDMTAIDAVEYETSANEVGTWAGGPLPENVTIALKAQTGHAGRNRRGRTFWIGLASNMLQAEPGMLIGTVVTSLVNAMDALVAHAFSNSGQLAMVHRKTGSTYLAEGVPFPIINYIAADQVVDSQRRRLPLHNRHR